MDKYTAKIIPILKKYGVSRASLFGSVVRGDTHKNSDVDILVEVPKKLNGLDFIGMKMDLQEELEKKLNKKVDLVEYHLIKESLKKYILPEQKPIYP
mgnify:CR=1 FL=1